MIGVINNAKRGFKRKSLVKGLTILYFLIGGIEVVAEYFNDKQLIYATKPFIMLILILLYWNSSKKLDLIYITALIFSWIANFFFISTAYESILVGAILFFFYRSLIIYIVLKHIKLPSVFPMIVGCMPFLFIYLYLVNITYPIIGEGLVIFIVQCILISFLGGLSVGNYILRSNKANTLLLISTLLFAVTQFIFVMRMYYISVNLFQPVAMALFILAQYLFYRFVLLAEKKRAGYKIAAQSNV